MSGTTRRRRPARAGRRPHVDPLERHDAQTSTRSSGTTPRRRPARAAALLPPPSSLAHGQVGCLVVTSLVEGVRPGRLPPPSSLALLPKDTTSPPMNHSHLAPSFTYGNCNFNKKTMSAIIQKFKKIKKIKKFKKFKSRRAQELGSASSDRAGPGDF